MSSEAGPELLPVLLGEFVPTADGGIEEVGGVAVEEGCPFLFVGVPPGLFHEGLFALRLVEEVLLGRPDGVACLSPSHGGDAVGFAVVPECCIFTFTMLSAYAKHHWQFCVAGENGEARRLAGIVECDPCYAADVVGHPRAKLDDGAVGAPRHADGADVLHRGVVEQSGIAAYLVGTHPGVAYQGLAAFEFHLSVAFGQGVDTA